jgi:hypothetical protein
MLTVPIAIPLLTQARGQLQPSQPKSNLKQNRSYVKVTFIVQINWRGDFAISGATLVPNHIH